MSSEYIFEINDALYDHETGRVCMMPKIVGALIRCKDCKHHHYEGNIPYCGNIDYGYGWKDDDYCSRAERKSDENNATD